MLLRVTLIRLKLIFSKFRTRLRKECLLLATLAETLPCAATAPISMLIKAVHSTRQVRIRLWPVSAGSKIKCKTLNARWTAERSLSSGKTQSMCMLLASKLSSKCKNRRLRWLKITSAACNSKTTRKFYTQKSRL